MARSKESIAKLKNKRLLERELMEYKKRDGLDFKPTQFVRFLVPDLFKKYNNYGAEQISYCCNGIENLCWLEFIEEGNFGMDLDRVKTVILSYISHGKKYLYKKDRFFTCEKDGKFFIYAYLRDKIEYDYLIWFDNQNKGDKI